MKCSSWPSDLSPIDPQDRRSHAHSHHRTMPDTRAVTYSVWLAILAPTSWHARSAVLSCHWTRVLPHETMCPTNAPLSFATFSEASL
ncbi:hypothetical protein BC835DRAFT_437026 [Cytidiella melzeri]|nr:hypothetical protein BC835DRAFT_437026 [Cytidiella melzeri]